MWNLTTIDSVVETSRLLSEWRWENKTIPWNSTWTKIACAATIDLDVGSHPNRVPQVIWDSRVAVAVCDLIENSALSSDDIASAKAILLIPSSRPAGIKRQPNVTALRHKAGWQRAPHWRQTPKASAQLWASQALGSQIVSAISDELNHKNIGDVPWNSFRTALALFVEGY